MSKKPALKPRSIELTHLWVECTEAPVRNPRLIGARKRVFLETTEPEYQNDPNYALKCAESFRQHAELAWGGKWIVVKEEPPKPRAYGKQGRDLAFADILNGEDNKTKRWLNSYLENKFKMADLLKSVPQADPRSVSDRVNAERKKLGI
jgi:hypothetical protein